MNVRGICCLRPGVSGLSENIYVVSVVDRYLEHTRACVFNNGGNPEVYLSSADWMPRNLDRRVELMFPLQQEDLRKRVIRFIQVQMADNQRARILRKDGTYEKVIPGRSEPLRVQEYLYQQTMEEQENLRTQTPVRFVPIQGKDQ